MELKDFVCSKKKYPEDYEKETLKAIKIITSPYYDFVLFGSSVFKYLIYAGDIDILQPLPTKNIMVNMQSIINNIYMNKYIIGDIKAGIKNEYYGMYKSLGYIKNKNIYKYDYKYISKYNNINNLNLVNLKVNPSLNDWLLLRDEIHKLITIRWTTDDILKGYKIEGTKMYDLETVIKNKNDASLNKIDMYYNDNDRLVEMTNVFLSNDESVDSNKFIYQIKLNMLNYLLDEYKNYAKALKRAYTIARMSNDAIMLKKISPFLVSHINLFASVNSDINVVLDILESGNDIYNIRSLIYNHIKTILKKLKNLEMIDIYNDLGKTLKLLNNQKLFISSLENVKKNVLLISNKLTNEYIIKNNIDLNKYIP